MMQRNFEMPLLAKIDQLLPLHAAEKNCFPASQNAAAVQWHCILFQTTETNDEQRDVSKGHT